jgi:hypothetical protein
MAEGGEGCGGDCIAVLMVALPLGKQENIYAIAFLATKIS